MPSRRGCWASSRAPVGAPLDSRSVGPRLNSIGNPGEVEDAQLLLYHRLQQHASGNASRRGYESRGGTAYSTYVLAPTNSDQPHLTSIASSAFASRT